MTSSTVRTKSTLAMTLIKAFAAGILSVLVFQLSVSAVLSALALSPFPIYPMTPVPPLGVPQSLNWAFWGGLWALVLWPILRERSGLGYWLTAIVVGAIAVTAVLFFVVLPLKGQPVAVGWNLNLWAIIITLHAAFGLGVATFFRLLRVTL